jgi:hypothetical protein
MTKYHLNFIKESQIGYISKCKFDVSLPEGITLEELNEIKMIEIFNENKLVKYFKDSKLYEMSINEILNLKTEINNLKLKNRKYKNRLKYSKKQLQYYKSISEL